MTTQVDIANRALAEVGTRSQLTGSTIDPTQSEEALYCSLLYGPLRDFLLREGDYDWAMQETPAGAMTPGASIWPYIYAYPAGIIRVRQVIPAVVAFDPRPVEWNVFNVAGTRKIGSNTLLQFILCTVIPAEDLWDAIFTEAYVRLLASGLAFALENRIEASQVKLNEAISFAGIANLRDS